MSTSRSEAIAIGGFTLLEGYVVSLAEASDPDSPGRRAAAGGAAGREVQRDVNALDRAAVETLLRRLQQLKRELQGVIAGGGTDYRRFTAQSLIAEVDRLIADATRDLHDGTRSLFSNASRLGIASVEEPIKAARISVTPAPRLDAELVTSAFDLTGDLLTEPMQRFRNQVVQGIRRAATVGTSNGYVDLAKNIGDAGFDAASYKAERIVRTETARVLNQATYARLVGLAAQMPFLRKGWRASRDSRVRTGHREASETYARGKGIPIAQAFRVNVHQEARLGGGGLQVAAKLLGTALLRFPVDPEASPAGRLAAAATIMCRCNAFTDFDLADLRAWSTSRSRAVSPGAPAIQPGQTLGFPEPPIRTRRPTPTAVTPTVPKTPAPAAALTRKEPPRSTIPGGRELLKDFGEQIQQALEAAHKDLFEESGFNDDGPVREALQTINLDGTRGTMRRGAADHVEISDDIAEEISKSVAFVHTHPSSTPFSLADAYQLARFNKAGMTMIVYGRSGAWYELTAPTSYSLNNRTFVDSVLGQFQQDFQVEQFKAGNRARHRTSQMIPELARARGVSQMEVIAGAPNDPEMQELYTLHYQEEAVDAWKVIAARYNLHFRFYLPPASTLRPKNRSREAVEQLEDRTAEASRANGFDDRDISTAINRYMGPDTLTPMQERLLARLKTLGVEIDVTTGERRLSRKS